VAAEVSSEGDLIATYLAPLARRVPGALGLKDDCALLVAPPGTDLIVTTDAVASGVHFFPSDAPGDVAWKALAVNVSDLVAKGAVPFAYQMALSFPEAPQRDWMAAFAAGLDAAQTAFGLGLTGGDTDKRPGPLTITITAFGHVPKGRMVLRSGARPGDHLFVSGTLGDSALGLLLRQSPHLAHNWQLNAVEADHLAQRYLRPQPRLALAPALRDFATAAMDLSDGLMKDLGRLCETSSIGAIVQAAALPLSPAARAALHHDPALLTAIVAGGDDYEIICAVPESAAAGFRAATEAAGVPVASLGIFSQARDVMLVGPDGRAIELGNSGWDHF